MNKLVRYDVWHSDYYKGAIFEGPFEMPVLQGTNEVPKKLIRFSDSKQDRRDDLDAWVISYEHDVKFECVWNNAFKYEQKLLEHPGIISWDFSMYRNMPFGLQFWNCYRGRLLGSLHERLGGLCIPNLRPTDSRSFAYAFDGMPCESTISMSTVGNLKSKADQLIFKSYVDETVRRLHPSNILVNGKAPEYLFESAIRAGTKLFVFETQTAKVHSSRKEVL